MSHLSPRPEQGIITKTSPGSVDGAVARLIVLIAAKGLTLFGVIDHGGEARHHGVELRETKLVLFGDPVTGTPVMGAQPLAALDLPLKVLIWDDAGQTKVSYTDPSVLRHATTSPTTSSHPWPA